MAYILEKPYTRAERIEFVSLYIYKNNLKYVETESALYALEENEMLQNGQVIINPNFETEIKEQRKREFKSNFFEIKEFGYYRKQPKGYGSAIESLNTAFNIVSITGILPADTLTFYKEPDFSKEEQCTEEWLVFNSYKNERMTAAEFGEFYAKFVTAWNNEEHK